MSAVEEIALGKRLQLARKRAGLTQQQLCQKIGMGYSTLTKIERGAIKSPSVFTVAAIAEATAVPINELLGRGSIPELDKKTSKTGVKFVYFDVSGVLTNFSHKIFIDIAKDSGLPQDRVESVYWRHNDRLNKGKISLERLNEILAEEYKIKDFSWEKYYFANLGILKEGRKLFNWVARYYEVGLLSNHVFLDRMQRDNYIPKDGLVALIDSSRVGHIKPEPSIYRIAQKRAGVPANQILLVDNERPNLVSADQLGWQTAWFDDYQPAESADRVKHLLEF